MSLPGVVKATSLKWLCDQVTHYNKEHLFLVPRHL
jgi:hypothetical protein